VSWLNRGKEFHTTGDPLVHSRGGAELNKAFRKKKEPRTGEVTDRGDPNRLNMKKEGSETGDGGPDLNIITCRKDKKSSRPGG